MIIIPFTFVNKFIQPKKYFKLNLKVCFLLFTLAQIPIPSIFYQHTQNKKLKKKQQHIKTRKAKGKRKRNPHTNQQTIKYTLHHGGKGSISKKTGWNMIFVFLSQRRKWQNWFMKLKNGFVNHYKSSVLYAKTTTRSSSRSSTYSIGSRSREREDGEDFFWVL